MDSVRPFLSPSRALCLLLQLPALLQHNRPRILWTHPPGSLLLLCSRFLQLRKLLQCQLLSSRRLPRPQPLSSRRVRRSVELLRAQRSAAQSGDGDPADCTLTLRRASSARQADACCRRPAHSPFLHPLVERGCASEAAA